MDGFHAASFFFFFCSNSFLRFLACSKVKVKVAKKKKKTLPFLHGCFQINHYQIIYEQQRGQDFYITAKHEADVLQDRVEYLSK